MKVYRLKLLGLDTNGAQVHNLEVIKNPLGGETDAECIDYWSKVLRREVPAVAEVKFAWEEVV